MAATGSGALSTQSGDVEHQNGHQLLLIILSVVFSVITASCIGFRLYTRIYVVGKTFLEDVLITIGAVLAIALSVTYAIGGFHGFGKHIWEVIAHPSDFILIYKLAFIVTYLYGGANLFVKCSFLALYHRLDSRKPMRWAVYFLFFVEIGQFVSSCVVLGLSWMPPEHLLDGKANPLVGLNATQKFYNANGIISSVTSAAIYITPMFMLRGLAIPRRQKYAVAALFSLGFLSTAATCVKTYYAWNLVKQIDIYYKITNGILWIQVEVHSAIVCGSAQTFRSLLRGFCPNCCRSPTTVDSERNHPPQHGPPVSLPYTDPDTGHERPVDSSWQEWELSSTHELPDSVWMPTKERPASPRVVDLSVKGLAAGDSEGRVAVPPLGSRMSNVWVYDGKRFTHDPNWPLR